MVNRGGYTDKGKLEADIYRRVIRGAFIEGGKKSRVYKGEYI